MASQSEVVARLPPALGRAKSLVRIRSIWQKVQQSVCQPSVLHGMPKAIAFVAMRIFEVEPNMVVEAIQQGDPALFVSVLMRLQQIDKALVAGGRSVADRSPVIYAQHVVEGFRLVAEESFVKDGGLV